MKPNTKAAYTEGYQTAPRGDPLSYLPQDYFPSDPCQPPDWERGNAWLAGWFDGDEARDAAQMVA